MIWTSQRWRRKFGHESTRLFIDTITLAHSNLMSRDWKMVTSLLFANLAKNKELLDPKDGIAVLRENSKKQTDVDPYIGQLVLYQFRETFCFEYFTKLSALNEYLVFWEEQRTQLHSTHRFRWGGVG